jgi:RES domain-containing protein
MINASRKDEILSTEGSVLFGGRYNRKGLFGALYLSQGKEICLVERTKAAGGDIKNLQSQIIGEIEVSVDKVIDLTDKATMNHLGIRREDLIHPTDHAFSQLIGKLARDNGVDGLLVPSAAGSGNNLVVFDPESKVSIKSITNYKH